MADLEVLDVVSTKTVQSLVEVYGFDLQRSVDAVSSLSDDNKADINAAIEWLISHGEEDRGGAVMFQHCVHLDSGDAVPLIDPPALKYGSPCAKCESLENWVCLTCGGTFCSRYQKGHALSHRQATQSDSSGLGHACAISLGDLSVWCFACDAYVEHERLKPLIAKMEALKFGEGSTCAGHVPPDSAAGGLSSKAAGKRIAVQPPAFESDPDDD
jgi:uncharacterized UBP type Zn finger protein